MSSHLNAELIQARQRELSAAADHSRHSSELLARKREPRGARGRRRTRLPRFALVAFERIAG